MRTIRSDRISDSRDLSFFFFLLLPTKAFNLFCRKLCIEALVEEGDQNQDWRLTSQEFLRLMDESYQPSNKCELWRHWLALASALALALVAELSLMTVNYDQ